MAIVTSYHCPWTRRHADDFVDSYGTQRSSSKNWDTKDNIIILKMPRCMMHGVRGYKKKKYWGCETNHQNVMKTRSGLLINTRPKSRQLANTRASGNTPAQASSSSSQKTSENNPAKSLIPTREKSMSNLSFVTRVALLSEGVGCDLGINHVSGQRLNGNQHANTRASPIKPTDAGTKSAKKIKVNTRARGSQEGPGWQAQNGTSSSSSYIESQGIVRTSRNYNNSNSNSSIDVNLEQLKSSLDNTNHEPSQRPGDSLILAQQRPSLAERHPVLLRYISRDEVLDATKSLLSLATGIPSNTPAGSSSFNKYQCTEEIVLVGGPTNQVRESAASSKLEINDTKQFTDKDSVSSDSTSTSQITIDDDNSSLASQSSSDETFLQQASELDETFLKDLTCFQLESHAYATDSNGNKIHRCTVCERVFTVFAAFKTHVNTHVRPRNRCALCGKIFSRSWLLKGHMRTHTGERPYACKYSGCNKKFADKSNLRSHLLIHTTKDKAFVCGKCNRAFAQKRYLHKHELEVCKI